MALFRKGSGPGSRRRSVDFGVADEGNLEHEIDVWVTSNRPKLGEVLLDLGSIDPDDLLDALEHQRENPSDEAAARVGEILLKLGKIDEDHLAAALAQQFNIPFVDLNDTTPEPEAVELVGEHLARKHSVIPLRIDEEGRTYLAVADPLDTEAIEELTQRCRRIGILMGGRSQIERLLNDSYNVLTQAKDHIRAFELTADGQDAKDADDDSFTVDENAPIVQVANRIITQAVRARASDVHIEPSEHGVRVRYRVDGAMTLAITLPLNMANALASRYKVMSQLNIVERRRPQDGQFGVTVDARPIDIRISTVPIVHGEKIVMRLLDKTKSLISLNDLGMHPVVHEQYVKIVKAPLGMLLCTGPTGSGKTTTLYATLSEIEDPSRNVVTIEDPVEYQFDGISQMPVSDTGMSFADGLRGILRQDPDVILVGEIRDEETARIAMQASLTGHFVLSSLHAVDSVAAVHRFTDMGIEPFLVASALTGVVGQRLLRRICGNCKTTYTPTPSEISVIDAQVGHQPTEWVKGRGCNLCSGTGYRGRVGVYELLVVSDSIREMIVDRASHHEMRAVAIEEGMRTMQAQAFEMVVNGITTIEDVVRSVYAPGIDVEESAPLELPRGRSAIGRGRSQIRRGPDEVEEGGAEMLPEDHGAVAVDQTGGASFEPLPKSDAGGDTPEASAGSKPDEVESTGEAKPAEKPQSAPRQRVSVKPSTAPAEDASPGGKDTGGSKSEVGSESRSPGAATNGKSNSDKTAPTPAPAGATTEVGVSE